MPKKQTKAQDNLASEVQAKLDYLRGKHRQRDLNFDKLDHIYNLEHQDAFGWGEPVNASDVRVNSAVPVKMIKHLKGRFLGSELRIAAAPLKESDRSLAGAGQIEDLLYGIMDLSRMRFGNILDRAYHFGFGRGWSSWFVGYDPSFKQVNDKDIGCPFVWKAIDPKYLYYEPYGVKERFQSAVYAFERRRVDIEREWGLEGQLGQKSEGPHSPDDDMLDYCDYWWWGRSKKEPKGEDNLKPWVIWHAVTAGAYVLKDAEEMPGYNVLPYITWFVQPDPFGEVEAWARGVLWAMRETIDKWDRVAMRIFRRLTLEADNVYAAEAKSRFEADEWTGMTLSRTPGTINPVPRGWMLRPLIDIAPSQNADRMLEILGKEIQDVGLPDLAMGSLPGGDTQMSGITYTSLNDAASTWLAADVASLSDVLRTCCELLLSLARYYTKDEERTISLMRVVEGGAKPTVEWVKLGAKDLKDYVVAVAVSTETMADKLRKMQTGLQLMNLPPEKQVFDRATMMEEFFGIRDPQKMMERIYADIIRGLPEIQQRLAQAAARKLRIPAFIEQEAEQKQRQAEQERMQRLQPQGMPQGGQGPLPGPQPGQMPPGPGAIGNMPPPGAVPQGPGMGGELPPEVMAQMARMQGIMPPPGGMQ